MTSNEDFKTALKDAAEGKSPNNISPVIVYSLEDGVTMAWFGDLETDFMEKIKKEVAWPGVDIVLRRTTDGTAARFRRRSGGNGSKIVVIGEAPSRPKLL